VGFLIVSKLPVQSTPANVAQMHVYSRRTAANFIIHHRFLHSFLGAGFVTEFK
jgi:hypothetical protein